MHENSLFFLLGKKIHRYRVLVLIIWLLMIIGCVPFLSNMMAPFQTSGFVDTTSESAKADEYIKKEFQSTNEVLMISYHSNYLEATDRKFINKIKRSVKPLDDYPISHTIYLPTKGNHQISKDQHTAIVVVKFDVKTPLTQEQLNDIEQRIKKPKNMTRLFGGESVFFSEVNKQTQQDLFDADLVATPASIVMLIIIFGSLVAAFLPILLGGGCALLILTSLFFIGHAFTLSIFTLNIALLLGLCLSLDYSLFIVSRFRQELKKVSDISDAISHTLATAGKAVFFSGLAVFISLSALLIFPINILFSVGVGGLTAVFFAVIVALTLLPALLSLLNHRVNLGSIFSKAREREVSINVWGHLAERVVKHPMIYFVLVLTFLLVLGYPFLNAKFGISDYRILPKEAPGRQFFNLYQSQFNESRLNPIVLIVTAKRGDILSRKHLNQLYDFTRKLEKNPLVAEVSSLVSVNKNFSKKDYYQQYHSSMVKNNQALKTLLQDTTTKQSTLIQVVSKYLPNSNQTRLLIQQLRQLSLGDDLSLQVTGVPVNNLDVLERIAELFPYALAWIMILTYFILLLLLRSVFLPLKAILMNIVSLTASYGVLVFIFQEGHWHEWLNFDPQGMLDISVLIIIFCAIFGFSMDYEVFLLTRIKEAYEKNGDNNASIIEGIAQSSRIITSAAMIVIVICGSFMVADVLMVKQFGLGIAVAIFVDAFLVRSLLVPATMALVKKVNWYCPKWIDQRIPRW